MALEFGDLTTDERIALVALVELIAEGSGTVSQDEVDYVHQIAAVLGEDEYRAITEEVDRRFADVDALRQFLPRVTRPEARELIYATVLDEAMSETIDLEEGELLEWLAAQWNITTRFGEPEA